MTVSGLWLDIGATSKDDASEVVRVGDPVTVELCFRELRNRQAISAAMEYAAKYGVNLYFVVVP